MLDGWSWESLLEPAADAAQKLAEEKIKQGAALAIGQVVDQWKKVRWSDSEERYRTSLREQTSTTKVLGNPTPINIVSVYADVYVHDKPSAHRRFSQVLGDTDARVLDSIRDQHRTEALPLVLANRNLFILGRPGSGKTTFLKYVCLLACDGRIKRTPIFVSMKEWSDSALPLVDFITSQFDLCDFPDAGPFVHTLLRKGKAIVLLDGLDEINEAGSRRTSAIRSVVNFTKKYGKCQFCLTCRTASTDYSFEKLEYVEIADFTPDQQHKFVAQWYRGSPDLLTRFKTDWENQHQDGLRELGRTPLLLTLLCLAFDQTLEFPNRLVDLYKEAVDALLRKWDSSRLIVRDEFYRRLSPSRREHLLEFVASTLYFDSRVVFHKPELLLALHTYLRGLPDKEAATEADASDVIKQIEAQHGLLVERAQGVFSFSHLSIQEYLTASYIFKAGRPKLVQQLAGLGVTDRKWREVLLFTAGLLPSADDLLNEVGEHLAKLLGSDPGVLRFLAFNTCDLALRGQVVPAGLFPRRDPHWIKERLQLYIDTSKHGSPEFQVGCRA